MARALWSVAPGLMALREAPHPPRQGDAVRVRALFSGVSRGTEALVLAGQVPPTLHDTMRCPNQEGDFPFPVKYGYALVGQAVEAPSNLVGRAVFVLHPHQDEAVVGSDAVHLLPAGLPLRRAVLSANMETAINVVWDSGASLGDRVVVVGAGVVGLLVARLLAGIPGVHVDLVDHDPRKAPVAEALGLTVLPPSERPGAVDIAINASGSGAGLQAAIDAVGPEGKVIEASWHGAASVPLTLGAWFHPGRVALKSSQVGQLPPERLPRWTHRRRLALALDLLAAMPETDALLTHDIPFGEAPERLPALLSAGANALCPVLTYPV